MASPEQFRPFVPNAQTALGRAYLIAVKDCDGVMLATEANYVRDNPLLWLRALSLYAANLDHLIRQAKTRMKALYPDPGVSQAQFLEARKEHKRWSLVQEHRLHKIKARRSELVVEFGFTDIREVVMVGDVVGAFDEILAATEQHEWDRVAQVARLFLMKITGLTPPEETPEPTAQPGDAETLEELLSRIRGERS